MGAPLSFYRNAEGSFFHKTKGNGQRPRAPQTAQADASKALKNGFLPRKKKYGPGNSSCTGSVQHAVTTPGSSPTNYGTPINTAAAADIAAAAAAVDSHARGPAPSASSAMVSSSSVPAGDGVPLTTIGTPSSGAAGEGVVGLRSIPRAGVVVGAMVPSSTVAAVVPLQPQTMSNWSLVTVVKAPVPVRSPDGGEGGREREGGETKQLKKNPFG